MQLEGDTPYWGYVREAGIHLQARIDDIFRRYEVLPVGHGYIDAIVRPIYVENLLSDLAEESIAFSLVTWWYPRPINLSVPNDTEYVYGMGGPIAPGGKEWYSELCFGDFDLKSRGIDTGTSLKNPSELAQDCIRLFKRYYESAFRLEPWFHEKLCPGLWLCVPEDWRNLASRV